MNTPVNFEIAKLLKAKGYNNPELNFYFEDGELKENVLRETTGMDYGSEFTVEFSELLENWNDSGLTKKNGGRCFGCSKTEGYLETYSAPFISTVVMWLYEKYGIWIYVPYSHNKEIKFSWVLLNKDTSSNSKTGFNSPIEAYEAGITYALNNLI